MCVIIVITIDKGAARVNIMEDFKVKYASFDSLNALTRIARFGIKESEDLSDNIYTIYEWEYKYHRIATSNIFSTRKQNILSAIQEDMQPIINNVINALASVYSQWLDEHAILDPHTWAVKRVGDIADSSLEDLIAVAKSEYSRYVNTSPDEFYVDLIVYGAAYISNVVESLIAEDVANYEVEIEGNPELANDYQPSIDYLQSIDVNDGLAVKDYILETYGTVEYFLTNFVGTDATVNMLIALYEGCIFEAWYAHWSDYDIDSVREQNEQIFQQLLSVDKSDFGSVMAAINIALNGVHVTGSMLNYIGNVDYNVDKEFLTSLSNMDTSAWDEDLQAFGVYTEASTA